MTTVFEIDQSKIDAPNFPRPLAWWHGFVPTWPGVSVTAGPGETVRVQVDGSRKRGRALGDWLRTAGTSGRLAEAVTEVNPGSSGNGPPRWEQCDQPVHNGSMSAPQQCAYAMGHGGKCEA